MARAVPFKYIWEEGNVTYFRPPPPPIEKKTPPNIKKYGFNPTTNRKKNGVPLPGRLKWNSP